MLFGFAWEEGLSIFKNLIKKLRTEFSKLQINVSLTFEPFVKDGKAQYLSIIFLNNILTHILRKSQFTNQCITGRYN